MDLVSNAVPSGPSDGHLLLRDQFSIIYITTTITPLAGWLQRAGSQLVTNRISVWNHKYLRGGVANQRPAGCILLVVLHLQRHVDDDAYST